MRSTRSLLLVGCASLLALSVQLGVSAGPSEISPGPSLPAVDVTGPYVDSWILVRLQQPMENKGEDGSYLPLTGSSRFKAPSSCSINTAMAVNCFDTEASRKAVSAVIGVLSSICASP